MQNRKRLFTAFFVLFSASSTALTNLQEVYEDALAFDPTYQAAKATLNSNREARPAAIASLLPKLSASGSLSRARDQSTTTSYKTTESFSVSLDQSIFNLALWLAVGKANITIKEAVATYNAARQALMLRTSIAYFAVLEAEKDLLITQAEKQSSYRQLEQTQQKFEVGLVSITDVKQAQANYDAILASEISAENVIDNKQEELRQITGRHYNKLATLKNDIPLLTPDPEDIDRWVSIALEQNYLLQSQIYKAEIAKKEVSIKRAGHLPTLAGGLSFSNTSTSPSNADNSRKKSTTGTLTLTVPIFEGGAIASNTRKAAFDYDVAKANLDNQHRKTISNTRQAYLGIISGIRKIQADKRAIASSESALESTTAAFRVGTSTLLDVLIKQNDLYKVQRTYAQDLYKYITDTLSLKQAAGLLNEGDIAHVNSWLSLSSNNLAINTDLALDEE